MVRLGGGVAPTMPGRGNKEQEGPSHRSGLAPPELVPSAIQARDGDHGAAGGAARAAGG